MRPVVRIWFNTLKEGHSVIETAFSGVWSQILATTASFVTEGSGHYGLFQCDEQPDVLAVLFGYTSKELGEKVAQALNESVSVALDLVDPTDLLVVDIDVAELPLGSKIAILISDSEPAGSDSLPGRGSWAVSEPIILDPNQEPDPDAPRESKWVHIAPSDEADQLSKFGTVRNFAPIMESHMDSQPAE